MDDPAPSVAETASEPVEVEVVEKPKSITPGRFGSLTPEEANRRSIESRRRKAAERKREGKIVMAASKLKIREAPGRDELKGAALAVVHETARMFLADPEKYARTGRELASVAQVFFEILRLEHGQSTSNVEHLTMDDKIKAIRELQEQAQRRQQEQPQIEP